MTPSIGLALLALATSQTPTGQADLTVRVTKVRSQKGSVVCRLFSTGEGFPGHGKQVVAQTVAISGDTAVCVFAAVQAGTYAVAVFHDENGNGKLDTNFLGIPKEGVGVSNNVRPVLGPPSWSASKFEFSGDQTLTISLRY
jgi:uncharacterized protein (DUF2141 family)